MDSFQKNKDNHQFIVKLNICCNLLICFLMATWNLLINFNLIVKRQIT